MRHRESLGLRLPASIYARKDGLGPACKAAFLAAPAQPSASLLNHLLNRLRFVSIIIFTFKTDALDKVAACSKVRGPVKLESTSWVGRSGRVSSYVDIQDMVKKIGPGSYIFGSGWITYCIHFIFIP